MICEFRKTGKMTLNNVHSASDLTPKFAQYVYWVATAVAVGIGLAVVLYFSGWRYADVPVMAPSFRAGAVGRFLLAAAAVAYAIRWRELRGSCETAGSGMAAVAVVALLLSAVLRRFETDDAGLSVNIYGGTFYDPLVGFLALAVTAYLVMERWYQDRSAGKWVMPIAAVAVTALEFQLVSMMPGDPVVVLRGYWHSTAVLLSVVAYVLLGVGCALALISLGWHAQWRRFWRGRGVLSSIAAPELEAWMVRSNVGGFALLIAAALLWEGWAVAVPRAELFISLVEPWVFATAAVYGGHFFLLRILRPALAQTAFWVAGIYFSSLAAFVGINVGMA